MAVQVQPTCFFTSDGQTDLVLHNGGGPANPYQGRKGTTFDNGIPRTAFLGDGKFTYTGTLGTFSGVVLKRHDG